jgi:hypothetical protein
MNMRLRDKFRQLAGGLLPAFMRDLAPHATAPFSILFGNFRE